MILFNNRAFVALALPVALLSGCPADPEVEIQEIAQLMSAASVECIFLSDFLEEAEPTLYAARDRTLFEDAFVTGFQSALDNPNINFNADQVAPCKQALADTPCEVVLLNGTACDNLFSGTIALGDTCGSGECVPGASCALGGDDCGVCEADGETGDACDDDTDCGLGLRCDLDGTCAAKSLPPTFAAGDACVGSCGKDALLCNAEGVCEALDLVDVGGSCEADSSPYCLDQLSVNDCVDDVCVVRPALGESCADVQCNPLEAYCADGTCSARTAVGDACVDGNECVQGAQCLEGVCRDFFTVVEPQVCEETQP